MKSGVVIRRAVGADVKRVLELERGVALAPHWSEAEYAAMLDCGAEEGVRRGLLVAVGDVAVNDARVNDVTVNDVTVNDVTVNDEGPWGFAVGKVVGVDAELESVVVDAGLRRRGAGRALVQAMMEWSRDAGARAIDLEVRAGSGGVRTLYAGLGFVVVGMRPRYYRDPWDDAILMRCELKGEADEGRLDVECPV